MGLREEIKEYTQADGLISPDRNPTPDSTGNGLLYLSLYHILLVLRRESTAQDVLDFDRIVSSCFLETGLLKRSPTKTGEQEGKDDYIAVCFAAKVLNSKIGWLILNYGNKTRSWPFKWIYNNLIPGKMTAQSWFGKNPEVITHMQWCASVKPHPLRRLWWAASIFFSGTKNHSYCTLVHLMAWAHPDLGFIEEFALDFWFWRFNRRWAFGLKNVLTKELGDHPITLYWK